MNHSTDMLEVFKEILKYTDEQMDIIKSNPKYMQMIEKIPQLVST